MGHSNHYLSAFVVGLVLWTSSVQLVPCEFVDRQIPKKLVPRGGRDARVPMHSLCLAIALQLLQSLRESDAVHVLDHLLLALVFLPLAAVLMCASSLGSTGGRALHPRLHPLAGVHGPPQILLPLPHAQLSAAMASRTRG